MRTVTVLMIVAAMAVAAVSAASAQDYAASLSGLNEVGPVVTPAYGTACFVLDAQKVLHYNVVYAGLTGVETAAHIHCCAPANANAAALFPFPVLGSPMIGTFGPLTVQQEADLNAGLMYVNIHTTTFLSGELRGQIGAVAQPCVTPVEDSTWGAIKSLYDAQR